MVLEWLLGRSGVDALDHDLAFSDDRCDRSERGQRGQQQRTHDPQGEGDFVLVDPARGILVVEVKGGNIWCEQGEWFQQNRNTGHAQAIDPEAQASNTWFFPRWMFPMVSLHPRLGQGPLRMERWPRIKGVRCTQNN